MPVAVVNHRHPTNRYGLRPQITSAKCYLVCVRLNCFIAALFVLLLGIHAGCLAQGSTSNQQRLTLSHRSYNALDGLSSNCVFAIEKDALGFMWFATSKGLDRFDGNRFAPHLYADMVQPEQRLSQVFIKLTATPEHEFILRLSQAVDNQESDTVFTFNPVHPLSQGALLKQTSNRSDRRMLPGRISEWATPHPDSMQLQVEGLKPSPVFDGGRRFVAWNGGPDDWPILYRSWRKNTDVLYFTGDSIGHLKSRQFSNSLPTQGDEHSAIVRADRDGLVFFQLNRSLPYPKGSLIRQLWDGTTTLLGHWNDWFPMDRPDFNDQIFFRKNPWNGDMWCFTHDQLAIVNQDGALQWSGKISEHLQFASLINAMDFSGPNEAWIGSCKGLSLIHTERDGFEELFLAEVTIKDSIKGYLDGMNSCRSIVEWGSDSLVFSTNSHGIRLHHAGKSSMVAHEHGAGAALFLEEDTLFTATPNGIGIVTRQHPYHLIAPLTIPGPIWDMHRVGPSEWLIGGSGIFRVNTRSSTVTPEENTPLNDMGNIYHFSRDQDTLWAIGASGVFALDEASQSWSHWHDAVPGAPFIQEAHHRLIDARGNHWISTSTQGLLKWNPTTGNLKEMGSDFGLPSTTVYGGFETEEGQLWFSTDNGLFLLPSSNEKEVTIFDERHGLHETEFNRTGVHLGSSGTAYFSTINGIVKFDPSVIQVPRSNAPSLTITSVLQHSAKRDTIKDMASVFKEGGILQLDPSDDFVSIRFALLDYTQIPQFYRYRLVQEENSPSNWFPLSDPEINLSGLSPGLTTVEIQARLRGTTWLENSLQIPVLLASPWHRDPWNLILIGFLAVLVTGGGILLRLRVLRNRNELLATMVNERTSNLKEALELKDIYLREVHHRVKNNLQIIGSLLDLQAEKERLPATQKALSAGRSRIESISLVHKHLHIDANVRHVSLTDFIHEYVTRVEDALMEGEADVEWTLQGDDITLDIEPAQAFGVVLNELLTNSLQHVETRPLKIDIRWYESEQKKLNFEYKDNGPGLPGDTGPGISDSLGLNLISSLTKQLKGQVSLSSDNRAHWHFLLSCPFTNEEGRPSP